MAARELADHHRRLIEDSAISDGVAAARGYWTATQKTELQALGYAAAQRCVPALVITSRGLDGEIVGYQIRPDEPRISNETGKALKYESPFGSKPVLDVPPGCREAAWSPRTPLWITEGARKADAAVTVGLCCVSIAGVQAWRQRDDDGQSRVIADVERLPVKDRTVVLAFDQDAMTKLPVHQALTALSTHLIKRGAEVKVCYLPELGHVAKTGLDDYLATGASTDDLWNLVEEGLRPPPEPAKAKPDKPAQPTGYLLAYVERLLQKFVRFPDEHGRRAAALFVAHTWAIDAAMVTPYLYIKSPQKQSGKTRLLEVLELACRRPKRAASISEAAVFQAIEAWAPTLLIDEADAIFASKSERAEALRGILNAGNRRGNTVIRGTQEGEPREFGTFCPKALAGIDTGRLPDTIRDRSIVIGLERKLRSEPVERLRRDDIQDQLDDLHARLEDWALENAEQLKGYRCEPVPEISDRLEEAWEPLLAIAELAGGDWPTWARDAAKALAKGAEDAGEDHGQILLAALRDIFGSAEALFTKAICSKLNEDDELPFGASRRGEGLDGRGLGRLLKPFGIKPTTVSIDGTKAKGYHRSAFAEAWQRYTHAPEAAEDPFHPFHRYPDGASPGAEPNPGVTDSDDPSVTPSVTAESATQSQTDTLGNGVTAGTDEPQAHARAHADPEPLFDDPNGNAHCGGCGATLTHFAGKLVCVGCLRREKAA